MHTSTPRGLWKAHNIVIYSVLRSRQFYLSALCRAEVCARTRTKAYNTPTNIRKFPLNGKYLHLFFNKTHHGFNKNFHGRDFYRFSANISMRKRVHKPPNINNFYPRKFKFLHSRTLLSAKLSRPARRAEFYYKTTILREG